MEMEDLGRIDRATWRKYLFYLDLAVFAVFAISLVVLVRHAFAAGEWRGQGQTGFFSDTMWLVAVDTAFLVGALSWIVYRFFRNEYLVLTRRF
jgi:hypothetical protein